MRAQKHLAKIANAAYLEKKGTTVDISKNDRAMARLLKESNRCKTILSANNLVASSVEGLLEGFDFKTSLSRQELQEMCSDLFSQAVDPIKAVLKIANITIDDIKSLVLFGGGVRIPAIQESLTDFAGYSKIARNVDGDEAAVTGAVLHAAAVSAQFKLGQTSRIRDLNPKPIQISYTNENGK